MSGTVSLLQEILNNRQKSIFLLASYNISEAFELEVTFRTTATISFSLTSSHVHLQVLVHLFGRIFI